MPKKHGMSHALATLIGTIISGIILEFLKSYIPVIRKVFYFLGSQLSAFFEITFGVHLSTEVLSIALLATILAFFWGIAFKYMHSD